MHPVSLNHAVRDALETVQRAQRLTDRDILVLSENYRKLFSFLRLSLDWAARRTVSEFDHAASRLAVRCLHINQCIAVIQADTGSELIDPNFRMHDDLELVKQNCRSMRRKILQILGTQTLDQLSPKLHEAAKTLLKVVEETYAAANRLQWEMGERDATNTPRKKPWVVTNQKELDDALDQILSGK